MKFAHYDDITGKLLGWYDTDLHGGTIPSPVLEISDDEWNIAINSGANFVDKVNGAVLYKNLLTTEEALSEAKRLKSIELNSACRDVIVSGFASSALGSVHIYESEEEDQLNLTGVKDRGIDMPIKCSPDGGASWEWKTHTVSQIKSVFDDGVDFKLLNLQRCATLKGALASASTLSDVELILWN